MKHIVANVVAKGLLKVGNVFNGNVSPMEYYQPKKIQNKRG